MALAAWPRGPRARVVPDSEPPACAYCGRPATSAATRPGCGAPTEVPAPWRPRADRALLVPRPSALPIRYGFA